MYNSYVYPKIKVAEYMKKDVFISYVTPNLKIAEKFWAGLRKKGFSCFFAPKDMIAGPDFGGELVRAARDCHALLFLHSKQASEHDENVLSEIKTARKHNIPIICVMLDNSEPNDNLFYYINGLHSVMYTPTKFNKCMAEIEKALKMIVYAEKTNTENTEEATQAEEEAQDEEKPQTVFDYDPANGMMINPADGERNVSFRTDTFINMMGGIYQKVADISGEAAAQEIFFQSGYEGGKNFANRINSKWGNTSSIVEIKNKIQKWCSFDSMVGWGKFEANIEIDEEQDTLSGTLTITEAFIVDTQHKRKVCAFIRGYCTGVLNTLLGNLDVELICTSCRLEKSFNRKCVFDIKVKG